MIRILFTVAIFSFVFVGAVVSFESESELSAQDILQLIEARERGDDLEWEIQMQLIASGGTVRERTGKILRRTTERNTPEERSEQITVFLSPANIRHTALLTIEVQEEDILWLYLPALRSTRRIPAAERGDKFIGTDFTIEDVKLSFSSADYDAAIIKKHEYSGVRLATLRATPATNQLVSDLGHDYSIMTVRLDNFVLIEQKFYKNDVLIRHTFARDIRKIDGIWTPMELESIDMVSGHRTVLTVTDARYNIGLGDEMFRRQSLSRQAFR